MTQLPLFRPFRGLRPGREFAARVAAPPYDVLSSQEARLLAEGNPYSFLHVSKPEIDLPADLDAYAPEVYAKGAENLRRMIASGVLNQDPVPCFYIYRLQMGDHVQTGVAGGASVAAYDENRIRRHEFTRPDKEDDRTRQIDCCNAQTGPVLLAHRNSEALRRLVDSASAAPPTCSVTAVDGNIHSIWPVSEPDQVAELCIEFDAMAALYIADGHHRSAAASRVAKQRRSDAAQSFLAVSFPIEQMHILDYNRVVRDLDGMSADQFLARLGADFEVIPQAAAVRPAKSGEMGVYVAGHWYRLAPRRPPPSDPVARLDVSRLTDLILAPILGIADLRKDRRIDFVGGRRGLAELQTRVDSGEMAAAFALFPTAMKDLIAVADSGQVMPPKSTWFEPKLADGLVSYLL
jgi:uncharacterized protein (DUF1015 family)